MQRVAIFHTIPVGGLGGSASRWRSTKPRRTITPIKASKGHHKLDSSNSNRKWGPRSLSTNMDALPEVAER
jgi:hypothetical protein